MPPEDAASTPSRSEVTLLAAGANLPGVTPVLVLALDPAEACRLGRGAASDLPGMALLIREHPPVAGRTAAPAIVVPVVARISVFEEAGFPPRFSFLAAEGPAEAMALQLRILARKPMSSGNAARMTKVAAFGVFRTVEELRLRAAGLAVRKGGTRWSLMERLEIGRAYLHAHIDRTVSLGEAVAAAGMSTFHFTRRFSEAYRLPPASYQRRVRMRRAADLLGAGAGSVSEVAQAMGYSGLSTFTHAFRRQFGHAPSAIRPAGAR